MKRILLPQDGSEIGQVAVRAAAIQAQTFGAEVVVFGCVNLNDITATQLHVSPMGFAALLEEHQNEQREFLGKVVAELEESGVKARVRIGIGGPVEGILEAAETEEVDLIVIATHGRSGLRRLMLGSVAEGVLRRTQCPVLVCPIAKDE